jgi:hypothetical protein
MMPILDYLEMVSIHLYPEALAMNPIVYQIKEDFNEIGANKK